MNHTVPLLNTILLLMISVISINGCSYQSTRYITPAISGIIKTGEQPMSNVEIFLTLDADDQGCSKKYHATRTGLEGYFYIPAAKDTSKNIPFMSYHLDEWLVCARLNNRNIVIYSDNRYDMGSVNQNISLECDYNPETQQINCRKNR